MKHVTRFVEAALLISFVFVVYSNVRLRSEVRMLRANAVKGASGPATRSFLAGDLFDAGQFVVCHGCGSGPWPRGLKMVIVVNPNCGSCDEVAVKLAEALPSTRVPAVVISTGSDAETTSFARRHGFGLFTYLIRPGAPASKLTTAPQVFLADDHTVIGTCSSIADCTPLIEARLRSSRPE